MMPGGIITKKLWIIVIAFALIVIAIAVASDVFEIKSSVEPTSFVLIRDIINNTQDYLGKNITVRGFYYHGDLPENEGYLASDHVDLPIHEGSFENVNYLKINFSGLDINFVDDVEYYVTGTLGTSETTPIQEIVLFVENVQQV